MNINYIILAHKDPLQLKRLINGLSNSNSEFYIHVDKNADIEPFISEIKPNKRIHFLKEHQRVACVWGGIGIVEGTLNCMKQVLKDDRKGYCVLLSGQDYPIKNNVYLNLYLQYHKGINFINGTALPKAEWDNGGLDRISNYHYFLSSHKQHAISLPSLWDKSYWSNLKKSVVKTLMVLKNGQIPHEIFKKRKFTAKLKPFGGSQWWTLPVETIQLIVDFVSENPDYLKFHKHTHIPDETFFHSIIFSLVPKEKIKPSLTFIEWNGVAASPMTFQTNDYKAIRDSGSRFMFARKFSEITDKLILDLIDLRLLNIRTTPSPQILGTEALESVEEKQAEII